MAQIDAVEKDMQVLAESNIRFQSLNVAECIAAEPGLADVQEKIVGGLRLPDDETGDCFQFCQQLMALAQQAGVEFKFGVDVQALMSDNDKITAVKTSAGEFKADKFVIAMGSYSAALLAPLGMKIPVYPVKGYSLTVPIKNPHKAPISTVMDETYKVAMTRFDERIRVAGTAELCGYNLDLLAQRQATISMVINDLFPHAGDMEKAEFWTGLRPMTPDGTPIIGKTGFKNLFTNTGHGTLGWTMACGSGRYLADIVAGKQPDIDSAGLDIFRYQ